MPEGPNLTHLDEALLCMNFNEFVMMRGKVYFVFFPSKDGKSLSWQMVRIPQSRHFCVPGGGAARVEFPKYPYSPDRVLDVNGIDPGLAVSLAFTWARRKRLEWPMELRDTIRDLITRQDPESRKELGLSVDGGLPWPGY